MSRDKVDGSEMERNLHGDENVDMELCSQVIPGDSNAQDAEKAEDLNPVARMRKVNTKDREDVEAEDIYHARRSLGGYLARVSTVMNQVKVSSKHEALGTSSLIGQPCHFRCSGCKHPRHFIGPLTIAFCCQFTDAKPTLLVVFGSLLPLADLAVFLINSA